jgi:hypothetical protein
MNLSEMGCKNVQYVKLTRAIFCSECDEPSVSVTTGHFLNSVHEPQCHGVCKASYSISSPIKHYD